MCERNQVLMRLSKIVNLLAILRKATRRQKPLHEEALILLKTQINCVDV